MLLNRANHPVLGYLPQQVTGSPVKARAFSAENASLRSRSAPSRGNQFPLDTRLRRDTPSALRGG